MQVKVTSYDFKVGIVVGDNFYSVIEFVIKIGAARGWMADDTN